MRVDTSWFVDKIRETPYGSMRRISGKIRGRNGKPLDPSALSLMLRGKRSMQLEEARQFADLFDVPLIDVLRHAGISVPENRDRVVPVSGYIDKNGEVHLSKDEHDHVAIPGDATREAFALRCRTARSEQSIMDGWLFYAEGLQQARAEAVGRFCVVKIKAGKLFVAHVSRGYRPGTFNLQIGLPGIMRTSENTHLEKASPVLWIRTQQ